MTAMTIDPQRLLREKFGIEQFRAGQQAVISRLMAGKSAAAIFPTGGGKSLCYQLPAVAFEGLTLVISPLLALMREQVDQLNARGIQAVRLDSTLTAAETREAMQAIRQGQVRILYVAPERFFNERFREFIKDVPISLFAIDEAHCISQWGHNFRPDYLKLAKLTRDLQVERVLALTATATPAVLHDIKQEFGIAPEDAVQTPFYRSNLTLRFSLCDARSRDQQLIARLRNQPSAPTLVYVTLQRTAETVAEVLQAEGMPARAYHAGLDAALRSEIQDWFMGSDEAIVVATIAFGMGIDKANIRAIYHYNPSKSIENFAQEIGRAGRDDQPAVCETLLVPEDRVTLENFAYGDTPSLSAIRVLVEFLKGQREQFFVSHYSLAYEADIRVGVVRTLLTRLELEGYLEATSPRYELYKFKPLVSSQTILKHFEGERRSFASSVLSLAVKKKIWFEVNATRAADRLQCDRLRIVKMLDYFAEKGWIELQVSGLSYGYRQLKPLPDVETAAQELYQYVLDREIGELSRLDEFFQLATADACQSALLSQHFGQSIDGECGHCSVCENPRPQELPAPNYATVGDSAVTAIKNLRPQYPKLLHDARQQARFLCGLPSPKMSRSKLVREPMYGCCSEIPFDQVMEAMLV